MLLNKAQPRPLYKIGVYGGPGLGKTRLACTAPKPFILLTEKHGMETVRVASAELGIDIPVFWVTRVEQIPRIIKHLRTNPVDPLAAIMRDPDIVTDADLSQHDIADREDLVASLAYVKPETVCTDSITEVVDMIAADIDKQGGLEVKEGLEGRKLRAWTPINDRAFRVIRGLVDLPYHVVFTALENSRNLGSKNNPVTRIEPALAGKHLPIKLASRCNALGHMRMKREVQADLDGNKRLVITRSVQFALPDQYVSKIATHLREQEVPDISSWFAAMESKTKATGANASIGIDPNFDEYEGDAEEGDA